MFRRRFCTVAAVVLSVLVVAEPACHAALATKAGRKRFTAKLSSNPAIRRQQLIVDPEGILGGSASVAYDPRVVRLVDVDDPAEFEVTGGFVGVVPDPSKLVVDPGLVALGAFFERGEPTFGRGRPPGSPGDETGFVQVFFDRRDDGDDVANDGRAARSLGSGGAAPSVAAAAAGASVIPTLPGFVTVAEDGPTGVMDTHALVFEYLPDVPDDVQAAYSVYATPPLPGTRADFLIAADDPANPIPHTDLGGARVAGTLDVPGGRPNGGYGSLPPTAVPLPPAALTGLLTMAGAAGLQAWRRRRHAGRE